jgi:site-specific recombinase XerD
VYIPDLLIEPLRRVLAEQGNGSLLFPSEAGTAISPRNLVRQFKALLKKAELPDTIRFHDLRHTAASFALANGMDIKTTQDMLSHAEANTTLDIYGHVLKENKRVVVNDVVNRAFGNVVMEAKPQQNAE